MAHKVLEISVLDKLCSEIKSEMSEVYLRDKLSFLLDYYGLVNFDLSYGGVFWRARVSPDGKPFSYVHEVGCPPPDVVSTSRLNTKGSPVLYVSPNQFSAFAEVRPPVGAIVQFLAYEFREEQKLRCGLLGEIERAHCWGGLMSDSYSARSISRVLKEMSYDAGLSFVYTDVFLASLMRDKNASANEYLHSRTLAELLFSRNEKIQAIVYPGVVLEGATNLAILPSVADSVLKPVASIVVRNTGNFNFGFSRFEIVKETSAIAADGYFKWR